MPRLKSIALGIGLCCLSLTVQANDENDPLEPMNRAIFAFNKTVDKYFVKPLAQGYKFITPPPVQGMVRHFFSNMKDVSNAVNNTLQGNPGKAMNDVGRLVINTTLGVGGLVDVATGFGLEKHNEDLGQTLAVWGYRNSSYLVIPFFGASTVRDAIGAVGEIALTPYDYLKDDSYRYGLVALNILQRRADYISKEKALTAAAVDEYATVRDFYFQHRAYLISNGQAEDANLDVGVASY